MQGGYSLQNFDGVACNTVYDCRAIASSSLVVAFIFTIVQLR